ncbi:enoyl-[acyl-carrier-protein] reductase (NADH) [Amycolatopsis endophytica]|uniref:Enoyl-[acyl-carrier-protein] reductase (NADH) n=1 Tax=Amycolatopsis endophytica TaxID=860233 RepID=A0A853BDU8_9PSEU|nr:hypothetical protein [Amycolatopsis endophytica]NYI93618.1 enoyl-[acyl-carrier-protein] reductase (NADH) [Amycolatopsis endophytica]
MRHHSDGSKAPAVDQVAQIFGGEDTLNTMKADAKRMLADAKAGHWAVDEETGSHLRRAVTQMQERMIDLSLRIGRLQQAPKFGNDEYAKTAAAHFLAAMDSDEQSLVRVFHAAQEMLTSLGEAIDIAISKYNASEEAASEALNAFKEQETP